MPKIKTVSLRLFNSNKIPFKRIQNFRPATNLNFGKTIWKKINFQNNKIIETKNSQFTNKTNLMFRNHIPNFYFLAVEEKIIQFR